MTKREFLNRLETTIMRLPKAERDDIINDYEEHFRVGAAEGKSEHEVCIELGSPEDLGVSYLENAGVTNPVYVDQQMQAQNKMDPALKTLIFVLLLIFVLIPLGGTIFGFFCAIFGVSVAFLASAIGCVTAAFAVGGYLAVTLVCVAVALLALGTLLTIGGIALIRLLIKLCKLCYNYTKSL